MAQGVKATMADMAWAVASCPMKEGRTTEPHRASAEGSWASHFLVLGLSLLPSQMGYDVLCPSFLGHWEALWREGRFCCGRRWPRLVLLWLQLSLGVGGQVTPEASVPLARPRSSSVRWASRMVPKVCSQLYEKWILEKGSGEGSLPQYPCL